MSSDALLSARPRKLLMNSPSYSWPQRAAGILPT